MVQGVTLEQGHGNIHTGSDQAADQHCQQRFLILFHIGKDPRNAEKGQGHRILPDAFGGLRHTAFTSFFSVVSVSDDSP